MVQVENSVLARPQSGLQQADLVFEYLAEGGITRMTVIYFKPSGSQRIEPVRSARPVTIRLWHAYHGVIFYSGANQKVLDMIAQQQIPALDLVVTDQVTPRAEQYLNAWWDVVNWDEVAKRLDAAR